MNISLASQCVGRVGRPNTEETSRRQRQIMNARSGTMRLTANSCLPSETNSINYTLIFEFKNYFPKVLLLTFPHYIDLKASALWTTLITGRRAALLWSPLSDQREVWGFMITTKSLRSSLPPFSNRDKGLQYNHCRNPNPNEEEQEDGAWCYSTNPDKEWEYCEVRGCKS